MPQMTRPSTKQLSFPSRLSLALVALLAMATLPVLSSCEKHSDGDGHDHGKTAAKDPHAERDEHDHGAEEAHVDEVKLTLDAIERYGVKVGDAQLWILRPTFVAPARVGFNIEAMAHVGSMVRGRAVDIGVRLGDRVNKGDPLVVVESPELGQAQADFLLKRTAAETAVPQADLAKAAWDRAKGLLEQSQGISLTEVQKREAEYKAAMANVKSAEAAALAVENGLHLLGMDQKAVDALVVSGEIMPRYTIRAAIDGQVVQREITLGELVGPDRETIMILADTRSLWVLADVPEATLMGIAVGAKAWITIGSTTGQSDGSAAPRFEGIVSFIAPLVDPTTRTAQVRIEVPAALENGLTLRPGMFAQAEIVASMLGDTDPAPTVAIPDEAIQTVEGGPAVFVPVAGEPNTFAKRAVTIGKPIGGLVPIYAGLVEGERFVIAGTFILKAELGKGSAAHEH